MTSATYAGLTIEAPEGFVPEESMISLRVPAKDGFEDPRTSTPVRPNLVIHRRPARETTDLAAVVAKVRTELQTSIPGLSKVDSTDIQFADGEIGVLLAYTMPAPKGLSICQLQALRLDGEVVTSLTISTERDHLTDDLQARYIDALRSAAPAGA